MPQNVRAVRASPLSSGSCVILLYWDPPNNIPVSFISHYVVDYLSQTLTTLPRFTVTALSFENCDPDTTTIKIYAIDICGRNGFSTDNTLEKVLQETGVITAIPQNESTPTSETDVNMIPVECKSQLFYIDFCQFMWQPIFEKEKHVLCMVSYETMIFINLVRLFLMSMEDCRLATRIRDTVLVACDNDSGKFLLA